MKDTGVPLSRFVTGPAHVVLSEGTGPDGAGMEIQQTPSCRLLQHRAQCLPSASVMCLSLNSCSSAGVRTEGLGLKAATHNPRTVTQGAVSMTWGTQRAQTLRTTEVHTALRQALHL